MGWSALKGQVLYEAQKYLRSVADKLSRGFAEKLSLKVTWSAVVSEHVSETLIRAAEQGKDEEENKVGDACDLIALATRPRSDIERWTRGCVTDRVLGYTRLPLLIVRRQEQSVPVISEQVQAVHGSSG